MTPKQVLNLGRLLTPLVLLFLALGPRTGAETPTARAQADIAGLGSFEVSGPYEFANLAVYLIHGEDRLDPGIELVTLEEAMRAGKIKVRETGNVNTLIVQNRADVRVYVQAGDIVRGGKQDRLVAHDLLLDPQSGKVEVDVFCVESGRWSRRGVEAVAEFSGSRNIASGAALKVAVREAKAQGAVWREVSEMQAMLARGVAADVRSRQSSTSMELTLENPAVKNAASDYRAGLQKQLAQRDHVVGVVFAVNGELRGGRLYPASRLFRQLERRLLTSAAVEAVAGQTGGRTKQAPSAKEVAGLLSAAPTTAPRENEVGEDLEERRYDYSGFLRFDTHHADLGWTHLELLAED